MILIVINNIDNKYNNMSNNTQVIKSLLDTKTPLSKLSYLKTLTPTSICQMVSNPSSGLMKYIGTNTELVDQVNKIRLLCNGDSGRGQKSATQAAFYKLAQMIKRPAPEPFPQPPTGRLNIDGLRLARSLDIISHMKNDLTTLEKRIVGSTSVSKALSSNIMSHLETELPALKNTLAAAAGGTRRRRRVHRRSTRRA